MKIAKETKIGVLVAVALALMYYGFNFLKGTNIFKDQQYYYAIYENVKGLQTANPVVLNGFKVGVVTEIYMIPNDSTHKIMVEFALDEKINIPEDTKAVIEIDLLGTTAIGLRMGKSGLFAVSGDTLTGDVSTTIQEEVNLQLKPIKNKVENLMLSLDSVLITITTIFNENTKKNLTESFERIKNSLENLQHTTYNVDTLVSGQRKRFENIIANVESISYNIKTNNEKITEIIRNFSDVSDSLAKADFAGTITKTNKTLEDFNQIIDRINRGEGSLGQLVTNDSLYKNLQSASVELDQLVEDIKLHPSRYVHFSVFGKSDKKNPYISPEEEKKKKK